MAQEEITEMLHANRCYCYQLMKALFGSDPNAALIEVVLSDTTQLALEYALCGENIPDATIAESLEFLQELREAYSNEPEDLLENLKNEYTRLFIGPTALPAPPWESVYISKERMLFNETTLAVRETYLKGGFLPAGYPHEADDHLSTELDYLFILANKARDAFDSENYQELAEQSEEQLRFLTDHLLKWVPQFAKDIQKSKTHFLYPPMAKALCLFLKQDAKVLSI